MDMPLTEFNEFLHYRKEFIRINDLEAYKRARVQLHWRGVVLRDQVEGALIKTKDQQVARDGELLVAEIDAKVGGIGLVPPELDGAVVSSHYFLFEIDEGKCLRRWLEYFIRSGALEDQIAARGSTNYAAIRPHHVLDCEMPIPSIADQRRIVARIEELSAKIEEARRLRHQAQEETDALALSSAEVVFQGLAKRYGVATLGEACTSITDGDHITPTFMEDGVRFIFVGNVSSGRLHFDNCKRVGEGYFRTLKPQRVPQRDDILYSAVGATLGVPAIVDSDAPFCFQRHIAILKPARARLDSRFGWHMLRSRTVFSQAWNSTTGSAQPTVPLRAIRMLPIPIPSLPEQRRIVAYLDDLQAKVDAVRKLQDETAEELNALMPSILSRAFSGAL